MQLVSWLLPVQVVYANLTSAVLVSMLHDILPSVLLQLWNAGVLPAAAIGP